MRDALAAYVGSHPGSTIEKMALRQLERERALERQELEGHYHPYLEHAAELEVLAGQMRLELDPFEERANVRARVADYLERTVYRELGDLKFRELAEKLRIARRSGIVQFDPETKTHRKIWDAKAGEPLLCPDDAREEGMRLQRRLEEEIVSLYRRGFQVFYGVLTINNAQPGTLSAALDRLWKRYRRALKARADFGCSRLSAPVLRGRVRRAHVHARQAARVRRRPHHAPGQLRDCAPARRAKAGLDRKLPRRRRFPIVGSVATLEAPLSSSRTWHPHLNVIIITRGFFDWSQWHRQWRCWAKWERIEGNPEAVAAAFRELIKYAVRAVPEKSEAKAASASSAAAGADDSLSGHRAPAPAMIEWSALEFAEWWAAMKGRRRTRTYGKLYGLNKEPEAEQHERWITVGRIRHDGRRYVAEFPSLLSIPGDKSIRDPKLRREKWLADLTGPPAEMAQLHAQVEAALQAIDFQAMKETEGRR